MSWIDVTILVILVASMMAGMIQGFFRTAFSLGGLLGGLRLAASHYPSVAAVLRPAVPGEDTANVIGFFVIALAVMVVANLAGIALKRLFHWMGLGCLDRLGGVVVGFAQGALLVTACIVITVAFFPHAGWLVESRLPRMFLGACQRSERLLPVDLAAREHEGLQVLEKQLPAWTRP
jgi:membrane protein required for colicin V production